MFEYYRYFMKLFDFDYFFTSIPNHLAKVPITLFLGCVSFLLALFLGVLLAVIQQSRWRIIRGAVRVYISYFRSTPYITQLFILYFGLPQVIDCFRYLSAPMALILSIAMNSSAFIAEIIRGSFLSVDKGQIDAAVSVGLSKFHTMKDIVFPQALVSAIPALGNSFVNMIKSTSMGFTIGVVELLSQAKIGSVMSYRFLEGYMAVGLIYWALIVIVDHLQKRLEKRVGKYL